MNAGTSRTKPAEVGDRVEILVEIAGLRHRKNRNGKIMHIDGGYVYVQPMWCSWEIEVYHGEFRVL